MKKILSILAAVSITGTTSSLVVACSEPETVLKTIEFDKEQDNEIKEFDTLTIKVKNRSKLTGLSITTSGNITATLGGKNNDEISVKAGKYQEPSKNEGNKIDNSKNEASLTLTAKNAYTEIINFTIAKNDEAYKEIKLSEYNPEFKVGEEKEIIIDNYSELVNFKVTANSTKNIAYKLVNNKLKFKAKSEGSISLILSANNAKESKTIELKSTK
ncbi:lipoprotein [Spiroplasma floricola]|uniref:Lipoprotein n=1 Tax=Spiroplasma floricola 23-6 TaxID=1336749 RepID=A0A2K8SD52_9MOLU|nr:lipoprotein [Spiroplasma floricola]AUB31397.1 hypothetical protein SFLOR_v1c03400 [Spiroplasma floricola 23-6]